MVFFVFSHETCSAHRIGFVMDRPWLKFYTRDWLDNKELRRCSPLARSVLVDLMCLGQEGVPYGYLSDKVGDLSEDYMASRCFIQVSQFRLAMVELRRHERIHATEKGTLYIKRMAEDEALRLRRAEGGIKSIQHPHTFKPKGTLDGTHRNPQEGTLEGTEGTLEGTHHSQNKNASEGGGSSRARTSRALTLTSDSISQNGRGEGKPSRRDWQLDQQFRELKAGFDEAGVATIDADWADAYFVWPHLDFEQKLAAIDGIRKLKGQDPDFIKRPRKYLETSEWLRIKVKAERVKPFLDPLPTTEELLAREKAAEPEEARQRAQRRAAREAEKRAKGEKVETLEEIEERLRRRMPGTSAKSKEINNT